MILWKYDFNHIILLKFHSKFCNIRFLLKFQKLFFAVHGLKWCNCIHKIVLWMCFVLGKMGGGFKATIYNYFIYLILFSLCSKLFISNLVQNFKSMTISIIYHKQFSLILYILTIEPYRIAFKIWSKLIKYKFDAIRSRHGGLCT